jgi:hypothetical protein
LTGRRPCVPEDPSTTDEASVEAGYRMTLRAVALAVSITLVAATLLAASCAAQSPEDWAREPRNLSLETDPNDGFVFTGTRDTEEHYDVIRGSFDLDRATHQLVFVDQPEPGIDEIVSASNETWFAMSVRFVALVEYVDTDGDGAVSPLDDDIVERVELAGYRTPHMEADREDSETRTLTAVFPFTNGGSLELSFRLAPESHGPADHRLPPTATRLAVDVENYPYSSEDTLLALHTRVTTPNAISGDTSGELVVPDDPEDTAFQGRLAWAPTTTNGAGPVNSTIVTAGNGGGDVKTANLLWSYPRSDEIHHAGSIGVERPESALEPVFTLLGDWYYLRARVGGLGRALRRFRVRETQAGDPQREPSTRQPES